MAVSFTQDIRPLFTGINIAHMKSFCVALDDSGYRRAPGKLTAQEAHIARLAGEELPNWEIAAVPYLSPQAVEWHLGKIFTKLGSPPGGSCGGPLRRLAVAPCPAAGSP